VRSPYKISVKITLFL